MKRAILFTFIVLIGFACTKLDEELYDKIPGDLYPENENQVANLSVDAYAKLRPLCDDEGWWFLAQEISGDGLCGPQRDADWFDGGKWLNVHRHDWSRDDESVNRMWDVFWQGITTCNQTLDMMRELPESEQIKAKMSEVEVVRSFYYYLVLDNYGDAPYLTSAIGVPDQPFKIKRESIYDSLVTTVENALPRLKPIDNKYMATRNMGFALLAKLYINAEVYKGSPEWEKAGQYCDSIIAGPYSLESTVGGAFVTSNENSSEIIFSIPYDENNFQGFRLHMRTLHYQHNLKFDMPVGPWNGFAVVPTFFDTYEEADLRREAFHIFGMQYDSKGAEILDGETGEPLDIDPHLPALVMTAATHTPTQIRTTGARVGKYEIKMGAKENLSNDFPIFRLADFYLMKAEVEIRLNGAGSGDEWINPIRERAGVSAWSGATLDDLLAERGRELYVEGHRRQDLIRFGKFTEAWWEKTVTGDPSVETFPIPKWATDANPNLLKDPI
jgi:hypothetical protein